MIGSFANGFPCLAFLLFKQTGQKLQEIHFDDSFFALTEFLEEGAEMFNLVFLHIHSALENALAQIDHDLLEKIEF